MFSLFFVVMVYMSSSPVSIYSVSVGVDCGTISTRRMIFSCIRFSDFCSFLFRFQLSPPYVMMGWMQVSTISMRFQVLYCCSICFPIMARMVWYAASVFCDVFFYVIFHCSFVIHGFRPDIYMFVHIPVPFFPRVRGGFSFVLRFLVFCSLPYQIQCGICCYMVCYVEHFLEIFVVVSD